MKKIIPMVLLALLIGCSKGSQKTDPGPKFDINSEVISAQIKGAEGYIIKRGDLQAGPEFQIQTEQPESIKQITKELRCGSVLLKGAGSQSQNLGAFHFRISDNEFPGLNELPKKFSCKLSITLENQVGSKTTRDLDVQIVYDSIPDFPISRTLLNRKRYMFTGGQLEVERYSITNILRYPVGLTYNFGKALSTWYPGFSSMPKYQVKVDKFTIEGGYQVIYSTPTSTSIKILPGQTIVVRGFMSEPAHLAGNTNFDKNIFIEFDDVYRIPHTISLFEDFEFAPTDLNERNLHDAAPEKFNYF
jgi:hypothetical protein